jgi:hypothetical protein
MKSNERAYAYEPLAVDADAPKKLYDCLLKVEVPNVTIGDLVSLSSDFRKTIVEHLRTTCVPAVKHQENLYFLITAFKFLFMLSLPYMTFCTYDFLKNKFSKQEKVAEVSPK